MDPARSEAPLLPHRVPHFPPPAILENSLSTPFQLPRMLRQITLHQVPQIITAADVGEGGWIPTFSRVVHLEMEIDRTGVDGPEAFNLTQFHGFSPALESLRVVIAYFPCSPIADLLDSFPHLRASLLSPTIGLATGSVSISHLSPFNLPARSQLPDPWSFTRRRELAQSSPSCCPNQTAFTSGNWA